MECGRVVLISVGEWVRCGLFNVSEEGRDWARQRWDVVGGVINERERREKEWVVGWFWLVTVG